MTTEKRETFQAQDGQTYPMPSSDEQELFDAIREQLSPEAVAAIAADLTPDTDDPNVNHQVLWFRQQLIAMLGNKEYASILNEIGY